MPASYEVAGMADDVIIKDELTRLDEMLDSQATEKKELILGAAEKLAMKYQDDPSQVCRRLQAVLATDHVIKDEDGEVIRTVYARVSRQYIRNLLPDQYKRAYAKPEPDDTPLDTMQECFTRLADLCKDMGKVWNNMLTDVQKIQKSDPVEYREVKQAWEKVLDPATLNVLAETEYKTIANISDSAGLLNIIKNAEVIFQSLQKLQVRRQKFSTAMKLNLRILFITHTHDHLAKKFAGSNSGNKMMSGIADSPELRRLSELVKCPGCGLDAERWIEAAQTAQEQGTEIPPYTAFCTT